MSLPDDPLEWKGEPLTEALFLEMAKPKRWKRETYLVHPKTYSLLRERFPDAFDYLSKSTHD